MPLNAPENAAYEIIVTPPAAARDIALHALNGQTPPPMTVIVQLQTERKSQKQTGRQKDRYTETDRRGLIGI